LPGEADTDIPGVVARLRNAVRERAAESSPKRGSIERIRSAKPLPAELAGDIHADAGGAEISARRGPLGGDRGVVAPGAEVQEVRRIVLVIADRPLIVDGVGALCIAFEEARIALGKVAVDRQAVAEAEIRALIEEGAAVGDRSGAAEALATRIEIA